MSRGFKGTGLLAGPDYANRIVLPFLDLAVLDEEHADALPGERPRLRGKGVDAVVDDDGAGRERVENLECDAIRALHPRTETLGDAGVAGHRRRRFAHAVDTGVGEARQHLLQV